MKIFIQESACPCGQLLAGLTVRGSDKPNRNEAGMYSQRQIAQPKYINMKQ